MTLAQQIVAHKTDAILSNAQIAQTVGCSDSYVRAAWLRHTQPEKYRYRENVRAYQRANAKKSAERQRAYRLANPEKCAERGRAYYWADREKFVERQRAYRAAHPEKVALAKRTYYLKNREKLIEYQRQRKKRQSRLNEQRPPQEATPGAV